MSFLLKIVVSILMLLTLSANGADKITVDNNNNESTKLKDIINSKVVAPATAITIQPIDNDKKVDRAVLKLEESISNQNQRLGDIWGVVNLLGYIAGLLGVLTTVVVIFFAIRSTKNAVAEAKLEANTILKDWIDKEGRDLLIRESRQVMVPELDRALLEIKNASTPVLVALDAELQKSYKLNQEYQEKYNKINEEQEADAEEVEQLNSSAQSENADNQDKVGKHIESEDAEVVFSNSVDKNTKDSSAESAVVLDEPQDTLTFRQKIRQVNTFAKNNRLDIAVSTLDAIIEELEGDESEIKVLQYIEASVLLAKLSFTKQYNPPVALAIYEKLENKFYPSDSKRIQLWLMRIFCEKALTYEKVNYYELAIGEYTKVINNFDISDTTHTVALTWVTRAYVGRGRCLWFIGDYSGVISLYTEFIEKFSGILNSLTSFSSFTIRAARSYKINGNSVGAIRLLRNAITLVRPKFSPNSFINSHIPEKLVLAELLAEDANSEEAFALCEEIINQYFDQESVQGDTYLFKAMLLKASILNKDGKIDEEIRVYEHLESIWNKSEEEESYLAAYVATAMVNKAITLSEHGKGIDALDVIKSIFNTFQNYSENEVNEQINRAKKLQSILER